MPAPRRICMCVPNWLSVEIDEVDLGRRELVGAALRVVGHVVVDGAEVQLDLPALEAVELGVGVLDGRLDGAAVVREQVVGVDHAELERPEVGTAVTARGDLAGGAAAFVALPPVVADVSSGADSSDVAAVVPSVAPVAAVEAGAASLPAGSVVASVGTVVVVIAARGGDERERQHGYEHPAECASPHIIPLSRSVDAPAAGAGPPCARCAQGKQTGRRLSRIHHDECCAMIGTARPTRA